MSILKRSVVRGRRRNVSYRQRIRFEHLESRRLLTVGIKDPGFSYVDANDDGLYYVSDGDIALVGGELNDGFFDTDVPDLPSYPAPLPDAGLVINGAPISVGSIDYSADKNLTVNTNLTATVIELESRERDVRLDDPTLQATNLLEIKADVDIISNDDVLRAVGSTSEITLRAGEDIALMGTRVQAGGLVVMDAGMDITVNPSGLNPAIVSASASISGTTAFDAGGTIDATEATITAQKEILMNTTGGSIVAPFSTMSANGSSQAKISLSADIFIDVPFADIFANKRIAMLADGDDVTVSFATLQTAPLTGAFIDLGAADRVVALGSTVSAGTAVNFTGTGGVVASFATLTAGNDTLSSVVLNSPFGSVDLDAATVTAKRLVDVNAEFDIFAPGAIISASGNSQAEVLLDAEGFIDLTGFAGVSATKLVAITADVDIIADNATIQAGPLISGRVAIVAGNDVSLEGANLTATEGVDVDAGNDINAAFSDIGATTNIFGFVSILASGNIDLSFSTISASDDIDIDADGDISLEQAQVDASGNSTATVFVFSGGELFAEAVNIFAQKRIVMTTAPSGGDLNVSFGTLQTSPLPGSFIDLVSQAFVVAESGTLSAGQAVDIDAFGVINLFGATVTAHVNNVVLIASLGIALDFASVSAPKEIKADAGATLFAGFSNLNAHGNQGFIDLDSVDEMRLDDSLLRARKSIDVESADRILADGAQLLAQGDVNSEVKMTAGTNLLLSGAAIRARALIDLCATGVVDLSSSSVGITHQSTGDIFICGSSIDVTDAVIKSPDILDFCLAPFGTPDCIGPGTLPPL